MDIYSGIFAFTQATFPILTALPVIVMDFQIPISLKELEHFYLILLGYFFTVVIIGFLGLNLADTTGCILAVAYTLLVFLGAACNFQLAKWTAQEQATRLTGWNKELAIQNPEHVAIKAAENTRAERRSRKTKRNSKPKR